MLNRRKLSQARGSITQQKSKSRQRSVSANKSMQQPMKKGLINLNKSINRKKHIKANESMDMTYCHGYKSNIDMFQFPTKQKKNSRHFSPVNNQHNLITEKSECRSASSQRRKIKRNKSNASSPYQGFLDEYPSNLNTQTDEELSYTQMRPKSTVKCSTRGSTSRKTPTNNNNNHKRCSISKYMEKDYQQTQKQLIDTKSQLYETRYELDRYQRKIKELQKQANDANQKYQQELEKSDEFFTKAEKYKVIAKDYRKDIEKLKQQNELLQCEINQYDEFIQQKEMSEAKFHKDRQYIIQDVLMALKQLQKQAQQVDKQGSLMYHINQMFESLKGLNQLQMEQINHGDGGASSKIKMTQDAIIYNSETLGTDDNGGTHSYQVTPQKQNYPIPMTFNQSFNQEISVSQHNRSQSSSIDNNHQAQQQQYDILIKIQEEMMKIKEDSSKVLHENQILKEKNNVLSNELQNERHRVEQSLIPQYKEAFDQLRKANEMMQRKVEELEKDKKQQSANKNNIADDLNDLKLKISKFEYENQNLREEREIFMQQIMSLESYNKNQEKMINYFQTGLTSQLTNQESFDIQNYINQKSKSQTQNLQQQQCPQASRTRSSDQQESLAMEQSFTGDQTALQSFAQNQKNESLQQSQISQGSKTLKQKLIHQNHNITESSMYVDTVPLEKSDIYVSGENLFSLSSTQPENHIRLTSPVNYIPPRQIDFNQQQILSQINGRETFGTNIILMQHFPRTSTNKNTKNEIIRIAEQSQSQEVTNRDKSLIKTGSHMSSTNQFYYIKSDNEQSISQDSKEEEDYEHDQDEVENQSETQVLKSKKSGNTSNLDSDRSLEHHIQMLRQNHQHNINQLQSQETFQAQSHQQSKEQVFSKATTKQNSSRQNTAKYHHQYLKSQVDQSNKENINEEEYVFQGKNTKIKSPAFQEQSITSELENVDYIQEINNRNESQKISYHNTGTLSQNTNCVNNSFHSNYMSERTMNLKKEIYSLDEEILMLQNSLKQALLKKNHENSQ